MVKYLRPPYPAIPLSLREIEEAGAVGRARTKTNDPYPDGAMDPNRTPLEIDIQGAIGEYAASKFLRLPWTGRLWSRPEWEAKRHKEGDVGRVLVKSVDKPGHRLLVPYKDRGWRDWPFALIVLDCLPYSAAMAGWLWGYEIMQDQYWDPGLPTPAWARLKSSLRAIDTLLPELRRLEADGVTMVVGARS